ncbi:hypothetical protein ATZ33_02695 [Enterococcus silesiacus]|uniref:Uncharacterized protein n=1 Tax=Enterococcus silesiacus TaxID=332949 RepID=A0A0S3K7V5_9ENTE|nr:hypothetical protein ATZ33_02695 [Enterococcus silesiacus]OJG93311.1 hypothetical protein RV15_GL001343 [Enterococcus silesiacus]
MFTNLVNLFFDAEGSFQWASIAAGISLIAAGISIWGTFRNNKIQKEINQQNIDANLKSKARLEWINNVRKETSELLSLSGRRQAYTYKLENLYKMGDYSDVEIKEIEKLNVDIFEVSNSITTQLYKLKLMFGPENGEILEDEYGLIMRGQWEQLELFTIGTNSYQNESKMKELIDKLREKETNKGKNEIIVGLINIIILSVMYDPKLFER